jgi:hypothetical protein
MASFSLAPYRSGDEVDIVALFKTVFGGDKTLEHWRWQFEANPYGRVFTSLARDSDHNGLIGQCAVMPVDLNVMGRRVKAGQALDTMVHADFRNLGIFEQSARHCFEQLKSDGYALVYGFPNRNAFPGWVRKLGWNRIAFGTRYYKRLSVYRSLEKTFSRFGFAAFGNFFFRRFVATKAKWSHYLLKRNLGEFQFIITDQVSDAYEELWQSIRSYEILSVWKDRRYFQWRYDSKPGGAYRYYSLVRGGRIDALCVVASTDGNLRIAEMAVRDHSIATGQYLVAKIILSALKEGAHSIAFSGISQGLFDEVFCGFERTIDTNHVFCVGVLESTGLAKIAELPFNWTITTGDSDSI